jgi:MFS family permease
LHAADIPPGNHQAAPIVEADFADADRPVGQRTAVAARAAAKPAVRFDVVELALARFARQELSKGHRYFYCTGIRCPERSGCAILERLKPPSLLKLPRAVWLIGWVSLATDAASEAIYPLLPFFLTQVLGAGAVSLGIVEGAAEAANSILKIVSGRIADRRSRRPIVLAGYSLSSLVRPFIAIARSWTHVFLVRFVDRIGKGVRSAPRDAMLATWATSSNRGKVYGFHQGMDDLGAVAGPALATLFLLFYPGHYRTLFALTIVPGAIAVALIFFIPEPDTAQPGQSSGPSILNSAFSIPGSLSPLPPSFTRFMLVLSLFTLGNSTDAFLLLRLTDTAGAATYIPLMWAALHIVKAGVSMVGGGWSDRVGRRTVIALGWVIYAVVYAGFALSSSLPALLAWFLIYGFYYGFAEGTQKALVSDLAPASRQGFAFGVYNAVVGLGGLAASVVFGLIWTAFGPVAAFGTGAALALAAAVLLFVAL